jgi:lactate permease
MYQTDWFSAAGTLILIADIIALVVLRVGPGWALRIYGQTLNQLKWAILTIAVILGLAFLFNYSGLTYTLGLAFAATAFLLTPPRTPSSPTCRRPRLTSWV